ncbi:MAG: GIY-YIG nuclease family protein [Eggerthellaceae bacterium]|nr:GIY-YIG nuclease family protein [Eggerthellaceae bacterium]
MYVLRCADDTLYTGYTVDVQARVATHNAGTGAKYTAARLPVILEAWAEFATKHDAMSAEAHFKQLARAEKMDMIVAATTPEDLANAIRTRFNL